MFMLERIAKLIDVKSIVTLALVATLVYVVIGGNPIDEKVFLLFFKRGNNDNYILFYEKER